MIRCRPVKGAKTVKVTFTIPDDGIGDQAVAVVGDFNDWDPATTPLGRKGDVRSATVTLPAGGRHVFRYLTDAGVWFNDPDAHGYQANPFGGDDSVLDLRPSTQPKGRRGPPRSAIDAAPWAGSRRRCRGRHRHRGLSALHRGRPDRVSGHTARPGDGRKSTVCGRIPS